MKINDQDVRTYGARQLTVDFKPPEKTDEYEWPDLFLEPQRLQNTIKCGTCTVVLLLRGKNRQEIVRNADELLALLNGPADVVLDGYPGIYKAAACASDFERTIDRQAYRLTLELSGYMTGSPITTKATQGQAIHRMGTRPVPCDITIYTAEAVEELELSGMEAPITVHNLKAGDKITITGAGYVLDAAKNNRFADVDLLAFPALLQTETVLTWTPASAEVSITYRPAWLM